MIRVEPRPEPRGFDRDVRQRGWQWLTDKGIALDSPPPKAPKLPSYWRDYNKPLWEIYSGVCAYLAIYFEIVTGAASTDHFIAKSKHAGEAYEWSNYRLACLDPNRRKRDYNDVLDPFQIRRDTFVLELSSGKISPHRDLEQIDPSLYKDAQKTITRLKLDSQEMNDCRARHWSAYLESHVSSTYLWKHSPFVYYEAARQGQL